MSQSVNGFQKSVLADAAITQFRLVKITSTGVDVATASSDKIFGVEQNGCALGEQACVRFAGTSKVTASAAISVGDYVTATTGGKAVTTTTDKHKAAGIALEAATADGDIIEIWLTGGLTLSV